LSGHDRPLQPGAYRIEGHAIICDNDCISDAHGVMPDGLKNPADWAAFQAHLDAAAIVISGRLGHEAHPNKPGRRRLVFTRKAGEGGFRREGDVTFLDPAHHDLQRALRAIAPQGGVVAVTGGTGVFDWFADRKLFTAFHLARAHGFMIAGGRPLFSEGRKNRTSAERLLESIGLRETERRMLDVEKRVELIRFG
jgi:dihydrofolate reductase